MDDASIFLEALQKPSPEERAAYLAQACGANDELRRNVELLLKAHDKAGDFLAQAPAPAGQTMDLPPTETAGAVIGAYKLIEQIGEGGMGTVWMAQQTAPVKRVVALKLIKAGMDSKQVIARFEAERQALALMDHPNIAKVLDGGTTDRRPHAPREESPHAEREVYVGRPYFVMDLVKGVPITRYCDEHHLTPRQRLELFIPVCQAVQHAHQKGIIHRDLKPSNVLVALYDGKPVPKVIDFGVAKATGVQLTEATLVTGFGNIVGTLEYMSPEQAEINQLDIDTRSDIYSLGVLLYELLAGSPPFSRKELEKAGMLEMLRVIREEEPSKPSTKLSTADGLPTLAANRGTEPAKLTRLVRGELDWIVMKALEKDRSRRYETANGFAMDVQRYLADEPVQACPSSVGYRLRKFARRNRATLTVVGLVLLILLTFTGGIGWNVRDRVAQRHVVEQAAERALSVSDEHMRVKDWSQALAEARRAETALATGPAPEVLRRRVAERIKDLEIILALEEIRLRRADGSHEVGGFLLAEQIADYERLLQGLEVRLNRTPLPDAAELVRRRSPSLRQALVEALDDWSAMTAQRFQMRVPDEKVRWVTELTRMLDDDPRCRDVRDAAKKGDVERLKQLSVEIDVARSSPNALYVLANHLAGRRELPAAAALQERAQRQYPGDFWVNEHLCLLYSHARPTQTELLDRAVHYGSIAVSLRPSSPGAYSNLGQALAKRGRHNEAIECYEKAIELAPRQALAHNNLGVALKKLNRPDEAITSYQRALDIDPMYFLAHVNLCSVLQEKNQIERAVFHGRRAIALQPDSSEAHNNLGLALSETDRIDEAMQMIRHAIKLDARNALAHNSLGSVLASQGKIKESLAHFKMATDLQPDFVAAWHNWGHALLVLKKPPEALAYLRTAVALDGKYAPGHIHLADAQWQTGERAAAIESHRAYLKLRPEDAKGHQSLGLRLVAMRKLDEAISHLGKAVKIAPKFLAARFNLGMALFENGQLEQAEECFRAVLEQDEMCAPAHAYLGIVLEGLGRPGEAVTQYRMALKLNPLDAQALNNLAWLLATAEDPKLRSPKEAVEFARRAVRINDGPAGHWDTLSVAAYRAGQWKEALAARVEKTKRTAMNTEDRLFLAMTHWQLGNKGDARRSYDEALAELKRIEEPDARLRDLRHEAEHLLGGTASDGKKGKGDPD